MDKIIIKGLELFAYHGVNPEEKENGQLFILDITALADIAAAGESDSLDDTVSYAKIIKTVSAVFTSEKNDLLERAAQRVAKAILDEYDKIQSVKILLKKPEAPIMADFKYVGVEIERSRGDNI